MSGAAAGLDAFVAQATELGLEEALVMQFRHRAEEWPSAEEMEAQSRSRAVLRAYGPHRAVH